jgi:predicted secreted Zn-dependent protease
LFAVSVTAAAAAWGLVSLVPGKTESERGPGARATLSLEAEAAHRPAVATLPDGTSVTEKREPRPFTITGSTARELIRDMEARCPSVAGRSQTCWAATSWKVTWDVRKAKADGLCSVSAASAQVAIVQSLPIWEAAETAPRSLRRSWKRMLARLEAHEEKHAVNGRNAAEAIAARIRGLEPVEECEDLDHAATRIGYRTISEFRAKDVELDRVTRLGSTEVPTLED